MPPSSVRHKEGFIIIIMFGEKDKLSASLHILLRRRVTPAASSQLPVMLHIHFKGLQ
jgi:hypothetical protein